ncbi:hypothetical protein BaRGS_00023828 [Batillaria attramentaria]|uniref:Sodium-dependent glucose transporter 1 n=1 Tax=Batillaria attramentaria TaxID=370345 RepID=A0ABD0KCV0_9CAEN
METEENIESNHTGGDEQQAAEGGVLSKLKNPEYRWKFLRTLWLGAACCALGFGVGQRGPAFLDIQIITRTDVEAASFFFTAGSVGCLAGSLVSGLIYDKLNKSILLFSCVFGMAAATIATPWCSIYGLMITAFFLSSFFGGGIDTAANAELLRIWGKDGEMSMQFMHFTFAFGGVISPLFTEPFLTPIPEDDEHSHNTTTSAPVANTSMGMISSTDSWIEQSNVTQNSTNSLPLTTDVHYAYLISGVFMFLTSIPLVVQWFQERFQKRRQGAKDEKNVKQPLPFALFIFVLIVLCVFYFLYCTVEDSFAAYLTTFVVKQLHWTKSKGAEVTSAYWAAFAACRFLSIFAIRLLSTVKLLIILGVTWMAAMLGFLLASQHEVTIGVWVCSIAAGATMSSIFPTGLIWMEEELVRVTGRVASAILIASSSGTMVNPILLGYLMAEVSPMWFPYLLFAESCMCFLVFVFLLTLSRLYLQQHYAMHEGTAKPEVFPTLEIEVPAPETDGHATGNSVM